MENRSNIQDSKTYGMPIRENKIPNLPICHLSTINMDSDNGSPNCKNFTGVLKKTYGISNLENSCNFTNSKPPNTDSVTESSSSKNVTGLIEKIDANSENLSNFNDQKTANVFMKENKISDSVVTGSLNFNNQNNTSSENQFIFKNFKPTDFVFGNNKLSGLPIHNVNSGTESSNCQNLTGEIEKPVQDVKNDITNENKSNITKKKTKKTVQMSGKKSVKKIKLTKEDDKDEVPENENMIETSSSKQVKQVLLVHNKHKYTAHGLKCFLTSRINNTRRGRPPSKNRDATKGKRNAKKEASQQK